MTTTKPITFPPPHGGYPTPSYDEAGARRRLTSYRAAGHTGASVYVLALDDMDRAASGLGTLGPSLHANPSYYIEVVL